MKKAHGMTVGELARLFNVEAKFNADLKVVKVQGWHERLPANHYINYGWIPPAPNIPNFETAILYPGTVIFEGISLNYNNNSKKQCKM